MKDKKLIFGIGIAFLFLATIGLSYAYFTATLVNKDVKDQIVTTGTLSLKYTDGPEINAKNIKPGWTISKTVTIENTGTLDAFYTIYWKELLNEIENDELVMSLTCESNTDTCSFIELQNKVIGAEANSISENVLISPGEIQTITLNFEFKELHLNQNYNQNKKFNGVINIKDSSSTATQKEYTMYARVIDQNDNPIASKTIELQTDNKTGTTNESGYVKVEGLKQGEHELIVKDENNTLDTKKISITQKKSSNVLDNNTIYVDTTLDEFTITIVLDNENKMNSITNLIVPPDECFSVYNDKILRYDYNNKDVCPKELIVPNKIGENDISQITNQDCFSTTDPCMGAFESKKIKKVIISDGITKINKNSFNDNNLVDITIPESITTIEQYAFSNNDLINAVIPNGVSTIGERAFRNNKITSITLPKSVNYIGKEAFNVNNLPNSQAFIYKRNSDGNEDKTTVIGYGGKSKDVIIPDNITSIGAYAFANCNLENVTIPNSITSIGKDAFSSNNLTNITIPSKEITIGEFAFSSNNLTNITIPDGISLISYGAFSSNDLINITIPNSVTTIEGYAFENNKLIDVTIPDGVTKIGALAFSYNNLTSVTLPNSITSIENSTFENNKLTSITIPDSVTTIGDSAFSNNNLTSVKLPDSITSIGDSAFSSNNLTSVILSNKITSIGKRTFADNKLTSIKLPDSITSIGDSAFSYNNLTSVTLPTNITTIENSTFENNKLTNIIIPNSVTSIGEMAFGNNKLSNISIPSSVTSIEVCAFNNNALPDSQAFIYSRNTDGSEDKTTVVSYGGKNKDIRIPDGVTTIGYRSFSNNDLISVTIPSSVTLIKWGAFEKNKLKQVIIKGKSSSKEFTDYSPYSIYWGWASDVTCVKDNTRNVTNGCITWGA